MEAFGEGLFWKDCCFYMGARVSSNNHYFGDRLHEIYPHSVPNGGVLSSYRPANDIMSGVWWGCYFSPKLRFAFGLANLAYGGIYRVAIIRLRNYTYGMILNHQYYVVEVAGQPPCQLNR